VNDGGSNGKGCCGIEVLADTAKLTNVVIAGFRQRRDLVRKGEVFITDETKVASRVDDVKWRTVYSVKSMLESDEQEFSLRGVEKDLQ